MLQAVTGTLQGKAVKDPSGYLGRWLEDVSEQCGLSLWYPKSRELSSECEEQYAIELLIRVVRNYYDVRGIGAARG